ncbi:GDP-mannose 4,6-dehydratase [Clostridium tertium]|jgi:CDP-glucose 4,6-dehydratase|uniref:GDP-mannose 4,6-dehydratase n=2 Tax=Bacillota TaxID=1239 RepID=A0A9X3XIQ9_9CLOT|nr:MULTISPECIES: GDP-mannose 4,6-dehydratase [Clostridium]EEH97092.1 putative sugar dehydratase/epimerase yfnG [Clostridium sp. 7_2_43FAA]MBU6134626.1 GDP-mannose 4,6-dehydratase [Clostridium tertium]MDB1949279.1 GDP-mannose 4,6-dehydratase [Clostridium tertium]MDB1953457.1 GDP-mannose 4,6-dehydratase [Clostridium tertium]MDB1957329.1 GDP-mannose 4,6-dehydratase [Clostridium tertium]
MVSTFWNNKNVFITGGTGFLGSYLVKKLVNYGANVTILVRDYIPQSNIYRGEEYKKVNVVHGTLEDYLLIERTLGEYEIDTVFHLAAQAIVGVANRNPLGTFKSNIEGTWNILEAARKSPLIKRVIVASSDKAYGDQEKLPYDENMPLQGKHPYDVSKSCADLIAQTYYETYKLPVCITRCGNLYGGGDLNFNRIIPQSIQSILNNKAPVIRSDGSFIRDYFYIEDAVDAYINLAEKVVELNLGGQAFNFSNEIQLTVLELVNKILKIMGSSMKPIILNQGSNEIIHQYLSAKKARTILGWSPNYTIDEGLSKTIEWYKDFLKKEI